MESFGNSLRQQREFRSISLEEIAETTMISLRFLQAIENGDFHSLPHPTFVKGFLRAYAKHIGLDGDEVVLGYEQVLLPQQEEEPEPLEEKRAGFVKKLPLPLMVGGSILLLLLLIGLALWSGKDSPQPESGGAAVSVHPLAGGDTGVAPDIQKPPLVLTPAQEVEKRENLNANP